MKSAKMLAQEIEQAFAQTRYPGDGAITVEYDGIHLECEEVACHFRGRDWRDLDADFLMKKTGALSFFSPEAFAYFLPAYLLVTLREYDRADILPSSVILHVTPSFSRRREWWEARIRCLTREQREAVAEWLQYVGQNYADDLQPETGEALEEYWVRYLRDT